MTGPVPKDCHERSIAALTAMGKVLGCMSQPVLEMLHRKVTHPEAQQALACQQIAESLWNLPAMVLMVRGRVHRCMPR